MKSKMQKHLPRYGCASKTAITNTKRTGLIEADKDANAKLNKSRANGIRNDASHAAMGFHSIKAAFASQ